MAAKKKVAAKKIGKGDVVCLRSGGPLMTVNDFWPAGLGGQARCVWFADGKKNEAAFSSAALRRRTVPADEI